MKEADEKCDAEMISTTTSPREDSLTKESNKEDINDKTNGLSGDDNVENEDNDDKGEEGEDVMSDDDEEMGEDTMEGEMGGKQTRIRLPLNVLSRVDSSLGLLTSKFTDLMKSSITGTIHLSEAASSLGVSKRRIYDITNVLEGVGVIVKRNRNIIQWKGEKSNIVSNLDYTNTADATATNKKNDVDQLEAERLKKIRKEIDDLYKEGSTLDIYLTMLKKLSKMKEYQYCTQNDILEASTSLKKSGNRQTNNDESLCHIAIRAPPGSTMEVPHPIEGGIDKSKKQYKLRICNKTAKIPILDIVISPNELNSENTIEKGCDSPKTATEYNENNNSSPSGFESGSNDVYLNKSTLIDIQVETPPSKKCRVANSLDDECTNNQEPGQESKISAPTLSVQAPQSNNNILFDETMSLPSSLPGVPGLIHAVDPIDVYHMTSKYDTESDMYVSMSNTRRINRVTMMTDAIVQGSILTATPYPASKRRKSNAKIYDSYLPLLEHEQGVSNFFMTL